MTDRSSARLDYTEAARLIYGARDPSVVHLAKVDAKVAAGQLRGDRRGEWVAAESVAAYLAGRTERQRLAGGRKPSRAAASAAEKARDARGSDQALFSIYREGLRDYFAAVLRRRHPTDASPAFRRAVLAGQWAIIAFPIVVILGGWWMQARAPREQAIVERALQQEIQNGNILRYVILEWSPVVREPESETSMIRVRYRYTAIGGKSVHTNRVYRVRGDSAVRIDDDAIARKPSS